MTDNDTQHAVDVQPCHTSATETKTAHGFLVPPDDSGGRLSKHFPCAHRRVRLPASHGAAAPASAGPDGCVLTATAVMEHSTPAVLTSHMMTWQKSSAQHGDVRFSHSDRQPSRLQRQRWRTRSDSGNFRLAPNHKP